MKAGDSSDDAYVQFERICANGNINMLIADQDRNLIWSSYSSAQRFQMQMEDWLYGSDRSRVQVLLSGKDYTLLRQTDERLQSEYLVLLGTLKKWKQSLHACGCGKHSGKCEHNKPAFL